MNARSDSEPQALLPMPRLLGLGIVAPGAVGCAELAAASKRPPGAPTVERLGDEATLKARRPPRLERMALIAAKEALGTFPVEGLGLVFGTGYGGLAATVELLEGLASRGMAFGSPTAFHQSVHSAVAGQLSLALDVRGPCLTASSRELSGESALKMGLQLLASKRASRVLVVAADEVVPALLSAFRAFGALDRGWVPGEGAAAVLLGEGDSDLSLEHCALAGHPASLLDLAGDSRHLLPLLKGVAQAVGPDPLVSLAAPGPDEDEESSPSTGSGRTEPLPSRSLGKDPADSSTGAVSAERTAVAEVWPGAELVFDTARFGFHPSAGLMRLVAAAMRLRAQPRPGPRCALVHGLAFGGGQSAVVLRHRGSAHR